MTNDPMGIGLQVLNRIAGLPVIDRLGLRKPTQKAVYHGARTGFQTAGAVNRTFKRVKGKGKPARVGAARESGVFDLTPTEDQQMMVQVVSEFAAEVLRPGAEAAETANNTPAEVLEQTGEFGLTLLNIAEDMGGLAAERSAVTGVLVAEALAKADMGQAVACLAPTAVATAISLWGDAAQQETYLSAFAGGDVPGAALAVCEPRPLFDPYLLHTTSTKTDDGYLLNGLKSGVIRGKDAEIFVVAANLEGSGPALFIIESGSKGISIEADPGMGLRAAGLSRLILDNVAVDEIALLGGAEDAVYRECIRLSRLAWSALAVGTCRAVLDYVSEYVKSRTAFGEPIANRQSVAFMVANIAIELEGMRLATYKAAARVDHDIEHGREVAIARRLASEYGMKIGADGVQLLGGHGFVKEHPVERWYRDLRAIAVMEGGLLV